MLSVNFVEKAGYAAYCTLKDGAREFFGGVRENGVFFCEKQAPYRELMLRALVNRVMRSGPEMLYAQDEWGVELARFGFKKQGGQYACERKNLKLPHDCEKV